MRVSPSLLAVAGFLASAQASASGELSVRNDDSHGSHNATAVCGRIAKDCNHTTKVYYPGLSPIVCFEEKAEPHEIQGHPSTSQLSTTLRPHRRMCQRVSLRLQPHRSSRRWCVELMYLPNGPPLTFHQMKIIWDTKTKFAVRTP